MLQISLFHRIFQWIRSSRPMHNHHSSRASDSGTPSAYKSRKLLWVALGVALAALVAAMWVGAQWRPQPVQVERILPEVGK